MIFIKYIIIQNNPKVNKKFSPEKSREKMHSAAAAVTSAANGVVETVYDLVDGFCHSTQSTAEKILITAASVVCGVVATAAVAYVVVASAIVGNAVVIGATAIGVS